MESRSITSERPEPDDVDPSEMTHSSPPHGLRPGADDMPDHRNEAGSDAWSPSERPTDPSRKLADCPACLDDAGEPTGEALVQKPSGTWVREQCDLCNGLRKVNDAALVLYLAQRAAK